MARGYSKVAGLVFATCDLLSDCVTVFDVQEQEGSPGLSGEINFSWNDKFTEEKKFGRGIIMLP